MMNTDCIFLSLLYLKLNDIVKCLQVCKLVYYLHSEYLWKQLIPIHYPYNMGIEKKTFLESYKSNYRLLMDFMSLYRSFGNLKYIN